MAAADDVRLMLSNSPDIFTADDTSSPCFLNTFDEEVQMDAFGAAKQLIRRSYATVCADDFPNLTEDDQVTVNGAVYTVLTVRIIQDGHMLEVGLQAVKE